MTSAPSFLMELPAWLNRLAAQSHKQLRTPEQKMEWVVGLSRMNILRGSGGPFAAAVFNMKTGEFISVGVNLVTTLNASVAHAEIVAITLAQQRFGAYSLAGRGIPPCELVSSAEPCAMCLGALPWSGIRSLVCGARKADVERAGFDEGCRPRNWAGRLRKKGIMIRLNVLGPQAARVILDYARAGGRLYNGRTGKAVRTTGAVPAPPAGRLR